MDREADPTRLNGSIPRLAQVLGLAGLLPQIAVIAVLASGDLAGRFPALSLGYAYAALILSFLGGLWWSLATHAGEDAPKWLWFASVAPTLIALATAWPWMVGQPWPGPSLVVLGVSLIAALVVDWRLVRLGLAPAGWIRLRAPLSIGLGALTLAAAIF